MSKCKGSSEGTIGSSKRGKFHYYTYKIVIYSKECQDHFNSKAHHLKVVCRVEKVPWHRGRSSLPFVCEPRCCSHSPTPEGR